MSVRRYLAAVLVCLALVPLNGCCKEKILEETVSADGMLVAFVQQTNCGATTPFVVDVGIRGTNASADPPESEWVFTVEGPPAVSVEWTGPRELLVTIPEAGTTLKRLVKWGEVSIEYSD